VRRVAGKLAGRRGLKCTYRRAFGAHLYTAAPGCVYVWRTHMPNARARGGGGVLSRSKPHGYASATALVLYYWQLSSD
jgi:hypothetical protein